MSFVIADRVKESTETTGTGPLTLSAAMAGFQRFSAVCSVGDRCFYALHAVDVSGASTGDWECGVGTYSATNVLTRTEVMSSSNAGSVVNLAAGVKHVYLSVIANQVRDLGEALTANRNYYVRKDGSDSNTGLTDTAGGAFLTIGRAVEVVYAIKSWSYYQIRIHVRTGVYAESVYLPPLPNGATAYLQGDRITLSNVVISATDGNAIEITSEPYNWLVEGFTVQTTNSGFGLVCSSGVSNVGYLRFGACASGHISVTKRSYLAMFGDIAVSGAAPTHVDINLNSQFVAYACAYVVTGVPVFSASFARLTDLSLAKFDETTFTGSATGKRYDVSGCSFLNTGGATLPGSVAGTTATGGQVA